MDPNDQTDFHLRQSSLSTLLELFKQWLSVSLMVSVQHF